MKSLLRLIRTLICILMVSLPAFSFCMASPAPLLLSEYGISLVLPEDIIYVERGFDPSSAEALALAGLDADTEELLAFFDELPARCLYGHSADGDLQIQIIVEPTHTDSFGDVSDEQLAASYREDFISVLSQSIAYADALDIATSVYAHPQTRFLVTSVTPSSALHRMLFGYRLQFYTVFSRHSIFINLISHTGIDAAAAYELIDAASFASPAPSSRISVLLPGNPEIVLFLTVFSLFALVMLIYSLTHRHSMPEKRAYTVVMLTMAGFFLAYVALSLLITGVLTLEFAYLALPAILSILFIRLLSVKPIQQSDKTKPTVFR